MSEIGSIIDRIINLLKNHPELCDVHFSKGYSEKFKDLPLKSYTVTIVPKTVEYKNAGFGGYFGKDENGSSYIGRVLVSTILLNIAVSKTADGSVCSDLLETISEILLSNRFGCTVNKITSERMTYNRMLSAVVLSVHLHISKAVCGPLVG